MNDTPATASSPVTEYTEQALEEGRRIFSGACDFVAGVDTLARLPGESLPEIAFAGRSNVGKSSLVNALTGRKTLARTSHTPGRTQQLNFFNLADRLLLVDMPGYGFAKVSKSQRSAWDRMIRSYLKGRTTLRCVFILVDSRHGLKDSDRDMMEMLDEAAVPYRIILTKTDKANDTMLKKLETELGATLKKHTAAFPQACPTSAHKQRGIAELRALMVEISA